MIYLLYGNITYLINKEIEKIIDENNINEYNIVKFTFDIGINSILEEANSISMFGGKKVVIINDSIIFSSNKVEYDEKKLLEYFNNPNKDSILIFTLEIDKLDERKKIVKEIKKIGKVKEFNEANNISFIFKDYKLNNELISFIKNRVGNNLGILKNEIEKLKLYKENPDEITKEDIISLVPEILESNLFNLIDGIVLKNKAKAFKIYNEMITNGEEPIKIIVMLANQFRLMFQVKELSKKNLNNDEIAKILNVHPYRVKLSVEKSFSYSEDEILKNIYNLADLDMKTKDGKIDKFLGLEMFILSV